MADSVQIFPPGFRVTGSTGQPVAGATLLFTLATTTTPLAVFADQDLNTSLGSTVYCNSAGEPVTSSGSTTRTLVYAGTADYKIECRNSDNVTLWLYDGVKGAIVAGGGGGGGGGSGITQAAADLRYVRNPNALPSDTNLDDTDLIPFWDNEEAANNYVTYATLKSEILTDYRAAGHMFSAGVRSVFYQAAAPTGWVKETATAINDAAIRTVTGSGGVTGGSAGFASVFAARTIAQNNLPNVTLTGTTNTAGAHTHVYTVYRGPFAAAGGGVQAYAATTELLNTQSAGDHSHTVTTSSINGGVTQQPMDFAVKYVDVIICTKS